MDMPDAVALDHYLQLAEPYLDRYGLSALFATVFVEGFGVPAPGQTLMIAAALLAAHGQLSITVVLVLAWVAAVLGDNLGYIIGRTGGHRLALRLGVRRSHLERVHGFFTRYGGGIVVVARFVDGLRQLNGVVAGTAEMPWWRFFAYNALGAGLWVGLWGYGAYRLGRHVGVLLSAFQRFEPWIAAAGVVGVLVLLVYLLRGRGREAERP
jgi:membrane protein DedA with SNARE-associated domain